MACAKIGAVFRNERASAKKKWQKIDHKMYSTTVYVWHIDTHTIYYYITHSARLHVAALPIVQSNDYNYCV